MSLQLRRKIQTVIGMISWKDLAARVGRCPACGPSLFVKLNETDWGVRCVRCGGAPNTLLIISAIKKYLDALWEKDVYIISKSGPLFDYLKKHSGNLTYSYFDQDVVPGAYSNGVQCQDVQRLTYSDNAFDLCIHSEVFEHVPDDQAGFDELYRVLRPGGFMIFTILINYRG